MFGIVHMMFALLPWILAAHPGEYVVIAAQDIGKVPAYDRPYTRYLSLTDSDEKQRLEDAVVNNGHFNQLSRENEIAPSAIVLDKKVLRINLKDYRWSVAVWESLADADPYYHVDALISGKKMRALAPILSDGHISQKIGDEDKLHCVKDNLAFLVEQSKSKTPILRADWFFNQTAAAVDRKPGYYDFLDVKSEKDFQKLVGFRADLVKDFGKIGREAIAVSGVTLQPRAIERQEKIGGSYWKTFDFKKATGNANPLRVLGEDIEKHYDASEQYAHLPNGMWATGLFNSKGEIQATAPDFIASDVRSKSQDKRVHVNVSCMRCHENGGLQNIDGWARNLFVPPFVLQGVDYDTIRILRQEYFRKLDPLIAKDRLVFTEAVKEATGWDSKTYAAKYAAYWERYEDAHVDLAWMAKDLDMKPEDLKAVVVKRIAQGNVDPNYGGVDLVLAGIANGGTIGIRQHEELYPLLQTLLRGERP